MDLLVHIVAFYDLVPAVLVTTDTKKFEKNPSPRNFAAFSGVFFVVVVTFNTDITSWAMLITVLRELFTQDLGRFTSRNLGCDFFQPLTNNEMGYIYDL